MLLARQNVLGFLLLCVEHPQGSQGGPGAVNGPFAQPALQLRLQPPGDPAAFANAPEKGL
jgi:hypothetical protein